VRALPAAGGACGAAHGLATAATGKAATCSDVYVQSPSNVYLQGVAIAQSRNKICWQLTELTSWGDQIASHLRERWLALDRTRSIRGREVHSLEHQRRHHREESRRQRRVDGAGGGGVEHVAEDAAAVLHIVRDRHRGEHLCAAVRLEPGPGSGETQRPVWRFCCSLDACTLLANTSVRDGEGGGARRLSLSLSPCLAPPPHHLFHCTLPARIDPLYKGPHYTRLSG
jgi:hypothetical protein